MIEFPGQPIGKGRPRIGRGGHAFTPPKTRAYEAAVAKRARQAMGNYPPFSGPLRVTLRAHMAVPASWSKRRRAAALSREMLPAARPDLDNIVKTILDGVNGICFADDAQICAMEADKIFSDDPRVTLEIQPIGLTHGTPPAA